MPINEGTSTVRPLTYRLQGIPAGWTKEQVHATFSTADQPCMTVNSLVPDVMNYGGHSDDGTDTLTATFLFSPPEQREPMLDGGCSTDLELDKDFTGFTPLNDPKVKIDGDIIAVTGLAGHAFGSWANTPYRMWLRDFLPSNIPNARILTYGYRALVQGGDQPKSILADHADAFMNDLMTIRSDPACENRPIVLIGHSLGGLIIKEFIVNLEEETRHHLPIRSLIFFGVPHLGLETNGTLPSMVKEQPSQTLVNELNRDSPTITSLTRRFMRVLSEAQFSIHSLYESQPTKTVIKNDTGQWVRQGEPVVMVPHSSAVLRHEREKHTLSVQGDHSSMVKLKKGQGSCYPSVAQWIKEDLKNDAHKPAKYKANNRFPQTRMKGLVIGSASQDPQRGKNMVTTLADRKSPPENQDAIHPSSNHQSSLNDAAECGRHDLVQFLLNKGADPNIRSRNGLTPVNSAAKNGHLQTVRILLGKGADMNSADGKGSTPLLNAVKNGHPKTVRFLLAQGASPNVENKRGWTPIKSAASNGNLEIARLLLDHGADLNVANEDGWAPVHSAVSKGHLETLQLLLERGAGIKVRTKRGWTLLSIAAYNGFVDIARFLLRKGVNADLANTRGWTPIKCAASNGHLEMVQLLLDKGADVTVASEDGWTPIDSAVSKGHLAIVRLIFEKRAVPKVRQKRGWTLLSIVAYNGRLKIARFLLTQGANPNATNGMGWTPVKCGANNGHFRMVQLLLDKGANLAVSSEDGWAAIHAATHNGHLKIVRLLLSRGADPTIRTKKGWTLVTIAAFNGHLGVIQLLVDKGVSSVMTSKDVSLSTNVAAQNGHLEVVRLLLDKGADLVGASKGRPKR